MRIIVDANIVFSAILNTNSKIGDILLNSSEYFEFISPDYLFKELEKYHQKIARITNLSIVEIQTLILKITKLIKFISVFQIPEEIWAEATQLAFDVDEKDTPYIAFSLFFKALIWSGDYQLKKGLINKGFNAIIPTDELFHLRLEGK